MSSHQWGGGGANACYSLTREFEKNEHKVEVVTVNYQGMPMAENMNGVMIHRLNSARRHKEYCSLAEMLSFIVKALPYVEKLNKLNNFDICLVFFGIPSGPIAYVLKKKYSLPYMIRFGGGDVPGFQERFTIVYKLLGAAIKKIWASGDALIANSNGLRQMALDYYSAKEFEVIYNGVDTEYFTPGITNHSVKVTILFVSRLIERKGLQFVIPKLRLIQERSKSLIELVVVGDGPYHETLVRLAEEYGASDIISFVGQKDKTEIVPYYQNADIFILPSKREGMPNVVLEAMACGLPVVMTPCQGAEELIDGNGYIASIEDFSDRIIDLVTHVDKRKAMGEISRERACEKFSWEKTANAYMRIMEEVCNGY